MKSRLRTTARALRAVLILPLLVALVPVRVVLVTLALVVRVPLRLTAWGGRRTARFGGRLRRGDVTAVAALSLVLVGVSSSAVVAAAVHEDERGSYDDAALAHHFGAAVFKVETNGCELRGSGSAWAVDAHHLVTNWHVVVNDTEPGLVSRDGDKFHGTVVGWSVSRDVAVIEVDRRLPVQLDWADPGHLSEGDHLLTLGYPVPGTDFSAIPGSIVSFDEVGDVRRTIRTDSKVDHGDSGGPALTARGKVAGIVTEFDPNYDGVQIVALATTRDRVQDWVTNTLADPSPPKVDCDRVYELFGAFPENDAPLPDTYGDDPFLDVLYDQCADGDLDACDELYFDAPTGSEYEAFGSTCGDTTSDRYDGECAQSFLPQVDGPDVRGDDKALDKLYDDCAAGDDDSCDLLWLRAPDGSAYRAFADICGGRRSQGSGGTCGAPRTDH